MENEVRDHHRINIDLAMQKAKDNPAIKEKVKSEIINRLRDMSRFFKFKPDSFALGSYADRLITYRITEYSLNKAISFCINNSKAFPSFSEFYEVVRGHLKPQTKNAYNELGEQIKTLESELEAQLEAQFNKVAPEKGLLAFCKWYMDKIMQLDMSNNFVNDPLAFKRNALFDWHDCYYRFDENAMRKVYLEKLEMNKLCYLKNETNVSNDYIKIFNLKRMINGKV